MGVAGRPLLVVGEVVVVLVVEASSFVDGDATSSVLTLRPLTVVVVVVVSIVKFPSS
jgi:uncharacterized membrane protein